MKNIKIILLFLPLLGLASCVKQKNCEGESGTFIYLEEPYKVNNKEIVAHFFLSRNEKKLNGDGYITEGNYSAPLFS